MRYINQLEYPHVPYHTNGEHPELPDELRNRTVALSGCGLCSAIMVIELLCLDKTVSVEEMVKISEENGAQPGVGTSLRILSPLIAEMFDLDYHGTNDLNEVVRHLQAGGVGIVHVGVPEGKEIGLFTKGAHYMTLVSTDGKEFCILDSAYTPDKFDLPERAGRVDDSRAPFLYCDIETLHSELTPQPCTKYHLFARKR